MGRPDASHRGGQWSGRRSHGLPHSLDQHGRPAFDGMATRRKPLKIKNKTTAAGYGALALIALAAWFVYKALAG